MSSEKSADKAESTPNSASDADELVTEVAKAQAPPGSDSQPDSPSSINGAVNPASSAPSKAATDSAVDTRQTGNAGTPPDTVPASESISSPAETAPDKAEQSKAAGTEAEKAGNDVENEAENEAEKEAVKKVEKESAKKVQRNPADENIRQALLQALEAHLQVFSALEEQLTEENLRQLLELRASMPDSILQVSKSKTAGLEGEPLAFARLIKAVTLTDQNTRQIMDLLGSADELSHKNTNQLVTARKLLRQLKSEIGWPQEAPKSSLFNRLLETERKLDEMAEMNQQFQEQLLASTKELVDTLGKALEQGNSSEASSLWDRIQGNINNLSGRAQHDFKLQTTEFRNQVNELRGWKKFAATEKKKELIGQMQQLSESKDKPSVVAKQINKLHEEWKRLGYSNQNEKLWQEFKSVSDTAYEPCKEYFKQQKASMAENFRQRTEICKKIEDFLTSLDRDTVKIVELKRFEDQVQNDWKKYAPVEQSKVKKLQKRFYELLNQVRDLKRSAAKKNGEIKQSLVDQAKRLVDLEDRRQAMNKARDLQAEWKTIGPSFYKDDRNYWEEFRAACDEIFKERDQARKALKSDIDKSLKASNEVLGKLEEMFEQEEDSFRESRKLFASLQRDFNQALSPNIKKERQRLQDRFTTLTRKIEARFRKLPDKKQLQALSALQARADACLSLENQLLSCEDDESFKKTVGEFDQAGWQQLEASGMPELDKAMETRLKSLSGLGSIRNLQKLIEQTDQQARRQVVEAEISANLDSPEQDKGLRMELQLNQLTTSFGKANMNDNKTREREARQLQLQFLCVGPLSQQARAELEPRVTQIIEKLL